MTNYEYKALKEAKSINASKCSSKYFNLFWFLVYYSICAYGFYLSYNANNYVTMGFIVIMAVAYFHNIEEIIENFSKTNRVLVNILFNVSNFTSTQWSEKQKEGFDKIIDIKPPEIPADINDELLYGKYVAECVAKLEDLATEIKRKYGHNEFNVLLDGDQSFCYALKSVLDKNTKNYLWNYYVPVYDNSQFLQWRVI